jgi:hypothetical protein
VSIIPVEEASKRRRLDYDVLLGEIDSVPEDQLAAPYQLASGPLGDFCESLHDLAAHVLMWDEINLAVLSEAAAGRAHWSLHPRWETAQAGRLLNSSGVQAGRRLPAGLLLHRLLAVKDAVLAELGRYEGPAWSGRGQAPRPAQGIGELAQKVWTVPGQPAFWHAAIHLNRLPAAARQARRESAPRS